MAKVLLIEDDEETATEIAADLDMRGFTVEQVADGRRGLARAQAESWDVLVVDRMLPEMDGLTIIETLRHQQIRTPALVLSALGGTDDRVRGLRAGGDDYVTKPFALEELSARLEALLRRPAEGRETLLRAGPLELDLVERIARRGQRTLELKPREFQLLAYLVRRQGQIVTRAMLFADVWKYHFVPKSNLVDVHVGLLRRKVDLPGEAPLLHSVRGAGFTLRA